MGAGTDVGGVGGSERGTGVPWADVLVSAIAAVSWALIGMAGTAALGLHLLEADAAGSLGPMTAAVVALGAGGAVTPSGDVSAFGLTGAEAVTAVEITPLGVGLVGALLLSWFFLRSLRTAGAVIAPAELLARAATMVALFVAVLGGLAWAGHDVVTIDGGALGLDDLPGGGGGGGVEIPGLGDLGDVGGLLPDRLGDLMDAQAAVGFTVDTVPTLLGGLLWSVGVLTIALLASRRTPLPPGWEAVHRVVRPAVSAVVTVLLVSVAAGFAAAAYGAIGDDRPGRIAGAALLGAPNGAWLGLGIGLFVPWDGRATGVLTGVLPAPLDRLLGMGTEQSVTLGRLAELDGRVWLLAVAVVVMMLLAGVLAAVRTPFEAARDSGAVGGAGAVGFAGFTGRCALRLGVVTGVALPLLVRLTDVSADASLSVLGFDAFEAGIELHGHLGTAVLLGVAWGAGAGAVGAALACATGAAGGRAAPLARGVRGVGVSGVVGDGAGGGGGGGAAVGGGAAGGGFAGVGLGGAGATGVGYGGEGDAGVGRGGAAGAGVGHGNAAGAGVGHGDAGDAGGGLRDAGAGKAERPAAGSGEGRSGPYTPSVPYRPPNPATNPYLRVPDRLREPEDARPGSPGGRGTDASPPEDARPAPPPGGPGPRPGGAAASTPAPSAPGFPPRPSGSVGPAGGARPVGPPAPNVPGPPGAPDTPGDERRPDGPPPLGDLYDAPTMVRPVGPPPRSPRRPGDPPRPGERPARDADDGPPPPPPPPPRPPSSPPPSPPHPPSVPPPPPPPPPAAPPPDRPKRPR
ncbi:streptophobe family protein [Streptomyces sp. NPDC003247]|uniref:streptophobe family protein n=1 Tax=Streptomyces sp. NPDC003247 TaxID=3364677 RepID=UPI00367B7A78